VAFLNYYVISAEHVGERFIFVVAPGVKLIEETRTPDEIEKAAVEKGHDVSYCSTYYGMTDQHRVEVRREVVKYLREWKNINVTDRWQLTVEPLLRIIVRNDLA
jgi:hypothetical protein